MDGTTNPSLPAVRCDRMVILCGRCQHRNHGMDGMDGSIPSIVARGQIRMDH